MNDVLDFSGFEPGRAPVLGILHAIKAFDGDWTADLVIDLIARGGRRTGPTVIDFLAERVDVDVLRAVLPFAWSGPDWPQRQLGTRRWVQLFKRAGYTTDATDGPWTRPPTGPVTAWRAARTDVPHGMAWSLTRSKAEFFNTRGPAQVIAVGPAAYQRGERAPLGLWQVTVAPVAVLAYFGDRDEDEVVLNPHRLRGRNTPRLVMPDSDEAIAARLA